MPPLTRAPGLLAGAASGLGPDRPLAWVWPEERIAVAWGPGEGRITGGKATFSRRTRVKLHSCL